MRQNAACLARLMPGALAILLLASCGGSPPSGEAAGTAASDSPGESAASSESAADGQATDNAAEGSSATASADVGPNSARIEIDGQVHEFSSDNGGVFRNDVYDAPDIETVTLETYTEANDVYAKVDFNVARGAAAEGEYVAGMLGQPEHRGIAGHGQVTLAIEKDPAKGRQMLASGSGRFTVSRDGDVYRVDYEIGGDGQFRAKDAAPVTGYIIVADLPRQ